MSYHHFTSYERSRIEIFHQLGYSNRQIGKALKRHHSSIGRELKRNLANGKYQAEKADLLSKQRRTSIHSCGKWSEDISEIVEKKLVATWSPEQIANTVTLGKISFKTIYSWLYSGKLNVPLTVLRRKGKSLTQPDNRGKFTIGKPISQRPQSIDTRDDFGHWELDTMVSSRGKSKGCFATFVERKSRLYTAIKIPDRTQCSMFKAIGELHATLPKNSFLTATTDRGKEFSCFPMVEEQLGIDVYFADAYCAWQRGSNENSNGLLREFYPKKTDLAKVSQEELAKNLFLMNNRPRKCLGWKSPIQVFLHEMAHFT